MSTNKRTTRYDEEFKRTLVGLYQSGGKTQAALCKEYGVSQTALTRRIKQYSTVETDDVHIAFRSIQRNFNPTSKIVDFQLRKG